MFIHVVDFVFADFNFHYIGLTNVRNSVRSHTYAQHRMMPFRLNGEISGYYSRTNNKIIDVISNDTKQQYTIDSIMVTDGYINDNSISRLLDESTVQDFVSSLERALKHTRSPLWRQVSIDRHITGVFNTFCILCGCTRIRIIHAYMIKHVFGCNQCSLRFCPY